MEAPPMKIGIVGGSGFYNLPGLSDAKTVKMVTEFGAPSEDLITGNVDGIPCVVLARHGKDHRLNPSEVNYRANIQALKEQGVTHILSATACGSLKEELPPGTFVVLDSFIDRTTKRCQTFHDQGSSSNFGTVCHIQMHPTFCPETSKEVLLAAKDLGMEDKIKPCGTVVTVEGPRFSTRAESNLFRSWGADVINMTTVPEVVLAKEAAISYCAVAMVTDYDCWKENEEVVDAQKVLAVMQSNVADIRRLFIKTMQLMSERNWQQVIAKNQATAKSGIIHH